MGDEDAAGFRGCIYLATGLLVVHITLAWLDLVGLPWHPALLVVLVSGLAIAGFRWIGSAGPPVEQGTRLGWADALAVTATGFFAVLAASGRITFPDFIYHWGIKGHRYFLLRGIDYEYLSYDWNLVLHPDYPQLLPELYAVHSLAAGGFREGPLLLWSAAFLAMLLVCARGSAFLACRTSPGTVLTCHHHRHPGHVRCRLLDGGELRLGDRSGSGCCSAFLGPAPESHW